MPTESPLTTVIVLRRNPRDLHAMSQALQCAFPQQLRILHATRHQELVQFLTHEEADVVVSEFRGLVPRRRVNWHDGLSFLRYLSRRRHRPVECLVILEDEDEAYGERCLEAGASSYAMDAQAIEAAVEVVMLASTNRRPLDLEVREMVLSDSAGEPIYALNSADPESRAFLNAMLHTHVRKISHALSSDEFEGLFMQSATFEAVFESHEGLGLFIGAAPEASQIEMGLPPPGSTLEESLVRPDVEASGFDGFQSSHGAGCPAAPIMV